MSRRQFGPDECLASIGDRIVGEQGVLQIVQQFKRAYESRLQQIEDEAGGGDCLPGLQAKVSLQQEWIRDLTELLVRAVLDLEQEDSSRVPMLEQKLEMSVRKGSETSKTDLQPAGNVENAENKSIDQSGNDQNQSEIVSAIQTLPSTRSAKLLNLVSCTPTLKRTKPLLTKTKCEQTLEAQEAPNENKMDVVQIEDSDEESKGCIPEKDLLQFIREIPGPTASPKYSILKRRRTPEMNDEGLSPPRKNLKLSSLCDIILEITGPEVFVSLLQKHGSLGLKHFVKDNNWPELFREILDNIGIKKFMFWLTRVPRVSPLNIVDGIFEQLAAQDANIKNIAIHIMETVPLTLILSQFGVERIVTEIHQLCQNSHFPVDKLFQLMMFKFSPNIEDIIPSFQNINIVRLEGMTVERTNSCEKDLSSFIERILTTFDKSRLASVFPKDKMLTFYDSKELTAGIVECSSNEILESCETLVQKLPKANLQEDTYKSLAQHLFTKIPFHDLSPYYVDHAIRLIQYDAPQ